MRLVERFWTTVVYVVTFGSISPYSDHQTPLVTPSDGSRLENAQGPIFKPPGGRLDGPGSDFLCDYRNMVGWSPCSTPDNRECWLKNDHTGQEYNIHTNYEDSNQTPVGVHRTYHMNITDGSINADGLDFTEGKFFNGTYPGPWIQACWGDVNHPRIPHSRFHAKCVTECHSRCHESPQKEWHQRSLAWHTPMADNAYGRC